MANDDLFLEWLSERGSGSWDSYCEAHTWLFAASDGRAPRRPSWTAALLTSLGHVEIDWRNDRWATAPACLVGLPSAGATAVLTGARTARLRATIEELACEDDLNDVVVAQYRPAEGPEVVHIQYGSRAALDRIVARLGIPFEPYAAERLSHLLPRLADMVSAAPITPQPPSGYSVEFLDPHSARWMSALSVEPGLFRFRSYRDQFRLFDGVRYREVDKDVGAWAAFATAGVSHLRFEPDSTTGTLIVPATARLPAVYARAAVLCSGLPPEFVPRALALRYMNVPTPIAMRIARAVGQPDPTR